jgi:predicted nucleic acid-binding protein
VPSLVVTEVGYFLRTQVHPEAEASFVDSIMDGALTLADLTTSDWRRVRELVRRYIDLKLGVVDAAVIATAERLGTDTIARINPRDFRAIHPAHIAAFRLLPLDGLV